MNQTSVDRDALPAAMLDIAKAHLRVRHDRDDLLIQQYIAMAIEAVERRCSINLNPATFALDVGYRWSGGPPSCWTAPSGAVRIALPVNNVQSFTLEDADGVDQAGPYTIEQADLGGSASAYLVGPTLPLAGGWAMTVDVGMDSLAQMAPAVAAAVLRLTGGYYENRESASAVLVDDFVGELLGVWRPSV